MKLQKLLSLAVVLITVLFANKTLAQDIILQSEDIAELNGAGNLKENPPVSNIDNIADGTWVRYEDVDLTGVLSFSAQVAKNNGGERTITMHISNALGDDIGAAVGTITYSGQNGWQNYEESATVNLTEAVSGVQDVYFVFGGGSLNTDFFTLKDFLIDPDALNVGDTFTDPDNSLITYKVTSSRDPLEVELSSFSLHGDPLTAEETEITIASAVTYENTAADKSYDFSVTAIGTGAFQDNIHLINVELPSSVVTLKQDSFSGCTNLETINLKNVVTLTGENVFFNCPKITTANLSSATELNGTFAFHGFGDSTLTSVDISSAVTLGRALFSTAQFSTINIPASVNSISTKTFWNCTALTEVSVNWLTAETIPVIDVSPNVPASTDPDSGEEIAAVNGDATFLGVDVANVNLLVPEGTQEFYAAAIGWQDFNIVGVDLSTEDILAGILDIKVTSEELSVNSSSTFTNGNLSIYDITGRALSSTILNSPSATVNISNLSSGIYIVKVAEGNVKLVKRFVKQ